MAHSARSDNGFSLLETLIGLTLTALIAAAVTNAVQTSIRLWNSSDNTEARREDARRLNLATTWLEHAISDNLMNTEPGTMFSGSAASVSFMVAGMTGPDKGGLSRLRIEAAPSGGCPGKTDLTLVWSDVVPDQDYSAYDEIIRPLLACQDRVELGYFGYVDDDVEPAWYGNWPRTAPLPIIVRIRAQGANGSQEKLARLQYASQILVSVADSYSDIE